MGVCNRCCLSPRRGRSISYSRLRKSWVFLTTLSVVKVTICWPATSINNQGHLKLLEAELVRQWKKPRVQANQVSKNWIWQTSCYRHNSNAQIEDLTSRKSCRNKGLYYIRILSMTRIWGRCAIISRCNRRSRGRGRWRRGRWLSRTLRRKLTMISGSETMLPMLARTDKEAGKAKDGAWEL